MKTALLALLLAFSLTAFATAQVPYYVQYAPAAPRVVLPAPVLPAPVYGVPVYGVPVYGVPVYGVPVYGTPVVAYRPVIGVPVPVVARRIVAMPVVPAPLATPLPAVVVTRGVAPVVTTRYRPFLGGTVSRVRYAPTAVVVPVY